MYGAMPHPGCADNELPTTVRIELAHNKTLPHIV